MNDNTTDSQLRGPLWQRLLGILGSMNLAIMLLLALCIITLAGTLTQQNQSQAYYDQLYGPFWTALFQFLELFQLYSSPWYLLLVSLLMISIAICLWRNSPNILASFGKSAKEYHPGKFSKERKWKVETLNSEKLSNIKSQFVKRGFTISTQTVGDELQIHANKGGLQKLGYLFIHISILIIFLGGLLDSNVFMDINLPNAEHALNSYSVKPADVPKGNILPETNTAFSAISTLAQGESEDTVMIREKGGYYLQKLPFQVKVSDIKTHFYPDGSAKDYSADIQVVDKAGNSHSGTISAQHSFSFQGYTISHRGNTGSNPKLQLSLYKLDKDKPLLDNTKIDLPFQFDDSQDQSIKIDDYKLENADPTHKIGLSGEFVNIGPSIQYHLLNKSGNKINVEYFLKPYLKQGREYYLLRVTENKKKSSIIYLPINKDLGLKRFLEFNNALYQKSLIHLLFSSELKDLFDEIDLKSDYVKKQTLKQLESLLQDYAHNGREQAINDQIKMIKENDQDTASLYMEKMLDFALLMVYKQVILNEDQNTNGKPKVDMNYFGELQKAVDQLKRLGINYIPVISQHSEDKGVILSVTRHPGKYIVFSGLFFLVMGILMIFYINYREYLIRIRAANGQPSLLVNAYTNRSDTQFDHEFLNFTDVLISITI